MSKELDDVLAAIDEADTTRSMILWEHMWPRNYDIWQYRAYEPATLKCGLMVRIEPAPQPLVKIEIRYG